MAEKVPTTLPCYRVQREALGLELPLTLQNRADEVI
jgi:hypothetical protein